MVAQEYLSIQLASDLHVAHGEYDWRKFLSQKSDGVDALVLLGDIMRLADFEQYYRFMENLCKSWTNVYLVPGNHEFYVELGEQILDLDILWGRLWQLHNAIPNLTVLHNEWVDLPGNIRLYGSILWSHIPQGFEVMTLPIKLRDGNFVDAKWLNETNRANVSKIKQVIHQSKLDGKRLLIATHYPPTEKTLLPEHLAGQYHYYYANNLDSLMGKDNIYIWMYGHSHLNMDFRTQGDTRIVSNQYKTKEKDYNPCKILWVRTLI